MKHEITKFDQGDFIGQAYIELNKRKLSGTRQRVLIDENIWHQVAKVGWFVSKKYPQGRVYLPNNIRLSMRLHRYCYMLYHNLDTLPKNLVVDHVNGDIFDCRESNLVLKTSNGNNRNIVSKCGKSVGVNKVGNKWTAATAINSKNVYLGHFQTKEEASQIRQTAITFLDMLDVLYLKGTDLHEILDEDFNLAFSIKEKLLNRYKESKK